MKTPHLTAILWLMSYAEALPFSPAAGAKSMNSPWLSKALGDGLCACSLTDQISDSFKPLFVLAGRSTDRAVFTHYESEGRLQCEVIAHFSSAAATVAHGLNALPCERPLPDSLDLLVGDPVCWPVLFPARES